ncbi:hypothetical protein Q5P01_006681 [Channa striata]|uniref:Uncharacterized protein n=1 Tax=Channa striata TaxID=64152 RepID=A0AA88N9E9_CHASR|nr:hypothetical protein Q5P01_006681 [Channa striata]
MTALVSPHPVTQDLGRCAGTGSSPDINNELARPGLVGDFAGAFSDHQRGGKKKPPARRLVASARLTAPHSTAIEVLCLSLVCSRLKLGEPNRHD